MYGGYGAPLTGVPIAISTEPPPEDMPDFYSYRVADSPVGDGAHWISQKLHELNRVADKLRIHGPP